MKTITLHPSTDLDAFVAWLRVYVRDNPASAPTETGAFTLLNIPNLRPGGEGAILAELMHIWTGPKGGIYDDGPAIVFECIRLGPSRLQIAARCQQAAFDGYFVGLLAAMGAAWLEIEPDLRRAGLLSDPESAQTAEDAPKPWENIPDVGWNRKAVELWHAGYTAKEIAERIDRDLTSKTILNVISNLRRIYSTDVVPERRSKSRSGRKLG
jgi:hypothetical protein